MKIELGCIATDVVTGFTGRVTGICNYLTGCSQALVVPKAKEDNTVADGHWFDLQRLRRTDDTSILALDNEETPGPDAPPPRRL